MIKAVSRAEHPGLENTSSTTQSAAVLELARKVLRIEAEAIEALVERLDQRFVDAVALIKQRTEQIKDGKRVNSGGGRVVVCGVGKSGLIARKIASTLASTGTPSFFLHAAEASHGDLGMITRGDVLLALSNSGETAEVLTILPLVKRRGASLIALTGDANSTLARQADIVLDARVEQEACPHNLAPTASTTAALALGDALAVALLNERNFSAEDFARSHPGGKLGRQLLTLVSDVMRTGDDVPCVDESASFAAALLEMSKKRMGMTAVVNAERKVIGIYTDGDLRRSLAIEHFDLRTARVADVMTPNPRTITEGELAAAAVEKMERYKVNQILVVDDNKRLVGALNMHDLFHAKVI